MSPGLTETLVSERLSQQETLKTRVESPEHLLEALTLPRLGTRCGASVSPTLNAEGALCTLPPVSHAGCADTHARAFTHPHTRTRAYREGFSRVLSS